MAVYRTVTANATLSDNTVQAEGTVSDEIARVTAVSQSVQPIVSSDYADLTNKPEINSHTLEGNQSSADLGLAPAEHTHTKSQITDFPSLATVATSGSYNDLSNKPTIPADLWEQGVDANDQPVAGAIKAKDYVDTDDVSRTNSAPWTGDFVAGGDNTATGPYSVMAGRGNRANSFSTTIGDSNTAAGGGGSTLFGTLNQATSGTWGFAAGVGNTISHNNTVAMGYQNTASNYNAVALGAINTASGYTSTALGYNNTSSGDSSLAVGRYNTASGYASTALGYQNTASARAAYAEGRNTVASGQCAHAEGWETEASGNQAHAEGHGTQATARYNHVFGEYNISDTGFTAANAKGTYIEIVGNGADAQNRSNARTLDWSGNEWVAGLVSVGASASPPTPTANNHLTTKKYVDDIVGNIETLLASI